jgi:hypothetical protein
MSPGRARSNPFSFFPHNRPVILNEAYLSAAESLP